MRRVLYALTIALVTLGAAACGGSDEGEGNASGDPDITKAEFIEQADAICAAGDEEIAAIEPPTSEEEAITLIVEEVIPNIRAQIAEVRALGFPEGDEETLASAFDDTNDVLDQIEASPEEFLGDADPFADVNPRLQEYGLTACGGS